MKCYSFVFFQPVKYVEAILSLRVYKVRCGQWSTAPGWMAGLPQVLMPGDGIGLSQAALWAVMRVSPDFLLYDTHSGFGRNEKQWPFSLSAVPKCPCDGLDLRCPREPPLMQEWPEVK